MNEDNPGGSSPRRSSGGVQGPPVRAPRHRVCRHHPGDDARGSPGLFPRELRSREHGAGDRGERRPENVPADDREDVRATSPGSAPESKRPVEPPQRETRVVVKEKDARRAYLEMGFHGPSMGDPDVYAWDLLSMILGSGETSRLYRGVKDGKGLVDSVTASSYTPRDPGLLFVGGTLSPEKARAALKEILLETFRMTAAPPEGGGTGARQDGHGDGFPVLSRIAIRSGPPRRLLRDDAERRGVRADVPAKDPGGDRRRHPGGREEISFPGNLTVSVVLPAGQGGGCPRRRSGQSFGRRTRSDGARGERRSEADRGEGGPRNGIRVIVRENRAVPVVAVQAGFLAGCGANRRRKAASPTSPRGCL